jgi:hypothetical protein
MRRLFTFGLLCALAGSCSDDGGGPPVDAAVDVPADLAGMIPDAATPLPDSAPALRLERPTDLPRPPGGRLPADLLPPER